MPQTIVVAVDGSGDFDNIQAAFDAVQPGDTVQIRAGTYQGPVTLNTPNVTVEGYPGDDVPHIVASNGSDGPHAVFTFGIDSDGSTLRGLEISGGREYVLKFETSWDYGDQAFGNAAQNITVENNILHDSGRDVIKLTPNSDGIRILNNDIFNSGRMGTDDDYPAYNAEGIDAVNVDDLYVAGNHIYNIATTGAYVKGGSQNAVFEGNLIENTGLSTAATPNSAGGIALGYTTDAEFFDADNTGYVQATNGIVRNNVIINTPDSAILIGGADNSLIENNTILNAGMDTDSLRWFLGGVAIYPMRTWTGGSNYVDAFSHGTVVINNIIHTAPSSAGDEAWVRNDPLVAPYGGMSLQGQIDGNIYWDGNGEIFFGGLTFAEHQQATGYDGSSSVYNFLEMIDSNGLVLPETPLAETGAGAQVGAQYGYSAEYVPEAQEDNQAPAVPVITEIETFEAPYYEGLLIHFQGSADTSFYNIYLNGEYVGYTTGDGYFLRQEGVFSFEVEAVDRYGNVSSRSEAVTVEYGDASSPDEPQEGETPDGETHDNETPDSETPDSEVPDDEPTIEPVEQTVATDGNDVFVGRSVAEMIDGLAGDDTLDYSSSNYGITVDLYRGVGYGAYAEGDTFVNIENLIGTQYSDHLSGSGGVNRISGGAGADMIIARGGDDIIEGGAGNDTYYWYRGSGNDIINQSTKLVGDQDTLEFGSYISRDDLEFDLDGSDLIVSVQGDNGGTLTVVNFVAEDGSEGLYQIKFDDGSVMSHADILSIATEGNQQPEDEPVDDPVLPPSPPEEDPAPVLDDEVYIAGSASETFVGETGLDTVSYAESTYGVTVDLYYGRGYGAYATGDILTSINNLIGTNFSDHLSGGISDNYIFGGASSDYIDGRYGNDTLVGGEGNDTIRGGRDDDTLWGQDGADVFVFDYGFGHDTIQDYELGTDILDFSGLNLTSIDELTVYHDNRGGVDGTVIETPSGGSVFLVDQLLTAEDLTLVV